MHMHMSYHVDVVSHRVNQLWREREEIMQSGYLTKDPHHGGKTVFSRARRRFFLLRGDVLQWYSDEKSSSGVSKGSVTLTDARIERRGAELVVQLADASQLVLRGDDLDRWEPVLRSAAIRMTNIEGASGSRPVGSLDPSAAEVAPVDIAPVEVVPVESHSGHLVAWFSHECGIPEAESAEYARKLAAKGCAGTRELAALVLMVEEDLDPLHVRRIQQSLADPSLRLDGPFNKFRNEVPTMVFGKEEIYREGILARVGPLTRSMQQEFEDNEGGSWLRELQYVTEQPARSQYPSTKGAVPDDKHDLIPSYTRDLGHDGWTLERFHAMQPAVGSGPGQIPEALSLAEVAALRAYTGPWFKAINFYLRYSSLSPEVHCCDTQPYYEHHEPRKCFLADPTRAGTCKGCGKREEEHSCQLIQSWATSAALLYNGIMKLSVASGPATVYRGVKEEFIQLPESFVKATGGSVRAQGSDALLPPPPRIKPCFG